MSGDNGDQAAYWNGEVGQRWARAQAALDAVFAPLTQALFEAAALREGEDVLDIGCGAGETSLIAARRVGPRGHVTAADLSAPLLAAARARAAREPGPSDRPLAPIAWVEADAQDHAFGEAGFTHALSRFGVMFFGDSAAAFANVRRALRPGGRLTFLCWRAVEENPWVAVPRAAVLPLIPDFAPPPADGPGPFRFARAEALGAVLDAAGFREIACARLDRTVRLGTGPSDAAAVAAAADLAVDLGPVARLLRDREPALREAGRAAVAAAFAPLAREGRVALEAGCWCVTARA